MEPGTLLKDRFEVGAHLMRTRQGELYAGVDKTSGAPCQIEIQVLSGFTGQEDMGLAQREVQIGKHLVGVEGFLCALDCGPIEPDRLFVAREILPEGRPLDLAGDLDGRVWRVLAAARRVEALAATGTVHRDLGPLTLRCGSDDSVHLAGFRLAKLEGVFEPGLDPRGFSFSWLPCAAPELLYSPDTVDQRADVYGLGVLLFMALTGTAPYPGPTLVDLVLQHDAVRRGEQPAPLPTRIDPQAPPGLNLICSQSLQLAPESRMPSAGAFAEFMEDWLAIRSSGSHTVELPQPELPLAVEAPPPASPIDEISFDDILPADMESTPFLSSDPSTDPAVGPPPDPDAVAIEPHTDPLGPGVGAGPRDSWGKSVRSTSDGEETTELSASVTVSLSDLGHDPSATGTELATPDLDEEEEPTPLSPEEAAALIASEPLDPIPEMQRTAALPVAEMPSPEAEEEALPTARLLEPEPLPTAGLLEPEPLPPTGGLLEPEPLPPAGGLLEPEPLPPAAGLIESEPLPPAEGSPEALDDEGPGRTATLSVAELPVELSPEEAAALLEDGLAGGSEEEKRNLWDPFSSEEGADEQVLEMEPLLESGEGLAASPADGELAEPAAEQDLGALDLTEAEGESEVLQAVADDPPTAALPTTTAAPPPTPLPLPDLPEPEPEPEIELLPPVAFERLKAREKVLVMSMPKDFELAVEDVRRLDAGGFSHLLLNMNGIKHLGGNQLEALTEIVSLSAGRGLETSMFCLKTDVQQLLKIMDMGDVLPPVLRTGSEDDAIGMVVSSSSTK